MGAGANRVCSPGLHPSTFSLHPFLFLPSAFYLPPSLLLLGAASAFFTAAEAALSALPSQRGDADPRRLLGVVRLARTLASVPLAVLALSALHTLAPGAGGVPFWPGLALLALAGGAGSLLTKAFALRHPTRVARPALAVVSWLLPVLGPLDCGLSAMSGWLADRLTPARVRSPRPPTAAEFAALGELATEDGALSPAEGEMIQEILKLGHKTAKDCMTPRVEAFALRDDLPNAEAAALLRAERRRRVPVYGETPDDIVGILDTAKFLRLAGDAPADAPHYSEVLDPPSFVSETMRAMDLLRSFLTRRQGMAVVVDEYGGTEGIVTLADLIEEVVGDALPTGEEDLYIEPLDERRLLAGGHARLDDLSEYPGFALAAEGLDTISGLIFNRLGYLPKSGSVLHVPPNLKITIRRVTRKLVSEVLVEREEAEVTSDK